MFHNLLDMYVSTCRFVAAVFTEKKPFELLLVNVETLISENVIFSLFSAEYLLTGLQ